MENTVKMDHLLLLKLLPNTKNKCHLRALKGNTDIISKKQIDVCPAAQNGLDWGRGAIGPCLETYLQESHDYTRISGFNKFLDFMAEEQNVTHV